MNIKLIACVWLISMTHIALKCCYKRSDSSTYPFNRRGLFKD